MTTEVTVYMITSEPSKSPKPYTMKHHLSVLKGLSPDGRMLYDMKYDEHKKSTLIGVWLCLAVGGFGAHRFYMGQSGMGWLYIIFSWTLLPFFISLVEAAFMQSRVKRHNNAMSRRLVAWVQEQDGDSA